MENLDKSKNKKDRKNNNYESPIFSATESPKINNYESPIFSATESPKINNYESPINNLSNVPIIDNKLNNFKLEPKSEKKEFKFAEIDLDTLILDLKIISKLKPGYKLSIKENSKDVNDIYIDNSYFQYIYRFFSDNSRDNTTKFLESLDREITNKIEEIFKEDKLNDKNMFLNSKENILLNLSHNLNLSLVGLNNLINTYTNDEYIISKIEMIINSFELKIRKISNILKVDK